MTISIAPALAFLLIFLVLKRGLSAFAASDRSALASGSSLTYNQTLISADGMFQFGLFSLQAGSSSFYLGVAYADRNPFTSVWIANRDKPVSSSAVCTFTSSGFVNLTDEGVVIWSIGTPTANASVLRMLNESNLVLQTANGSLVWQSFDNPGNTWLPEMSLGPGQKLQSWLTDTNPTGGPYSLIMSDNNNFISVYNGTTKYWDSGPWNGNQFSYVPEMTISYIYTYSFSNTTGFTYYVKANMSAGFNVSKFMITSSGLIVESSYDPNQLNWNNFWARPSNSCQVVRLCGQNSICNGQSQPNCACPAQGFRPVNSLEWEQQAFFHGCERKSALNCSYTSGSNDGFFPINQTSFTWNSTFSVATTDLQLCSQLCLGNCSCNGFYFSGSDVGSCSLFTDPLYDGTVSSSFDGAFYLRVAAADLVSEQVGKSDKRTSTGLIVGAVVGALAAAAALVSLAIYSVYRRRRIAAAKAPEAGLRAFKYAELQAATKNFKEIIGSGGFGVVYRGVIPVAGSRGGSSGGAANLAVAVKKLHRHDEGDKQFRAEVRTIGMIQHVNLSRMLGFCSEGRHRLLVYEMAENGSLDHLLFGGDDDAGKAAVPWSTRFNIVLGAARGIAYLHESCREFIIHCDIKPENILLDAACQAKVADFGMAKLVGREFSHVLTNTRGTRGYVAPEWLAGQAITAKADVYSFGMTVFEIVSGRRNIGGGGGPNNAVAGGIHDFFPVWAAQVIHEPHANLVSLLDSRLEAGDADVDELQRVLYCAVWCIQDSEDSRPPMSKVVQMLEGSLPAPMPPIPMSLQCLLETGSFELTSSSLFSQNGTLDSSHPSR